MDEPDRSRAMAEHMFTRVILADLMVHQIMAADDPLAELDWRSRYKLAAADVGLEQSPDALRHGYLQQLETFWEGVRHEVEARVRFQQGGVQS